MSGTVPDKGAFFGGVECSLFLEQKNRTGGTGENRRFLCELRCGICLKGTFLKVENEWRKKNAR